MPQATVSDAALGNNVSTRGTSFGVLSSSSSSISTSNPAGGDDHGGDPVGAPSGASSTLQTARIRLHGPAGCPSAAAPAAEAIQSPPVRRVPLPKRSLGTTLNVEEAKRLGANCSLEQLNEALSRLPVGKAHRSRRAELLRLLNAELVATPSEGDAAAFKEAAVMATSLEEAAKQEGMNLRSAMEASLHQTEAFAASPSEGRAPPQSIIEEVAVQKAIDASAGEELARRQEEQAHVAELQNALKVSAAEEAARRTDEIKTMLSMSTQRPSDDPEGRQARTSRPLGMKEGTEGYVASESEPSGPPPAVHQSPRSCAAGGQERSPSSPPSQPKAVASSSTDPQPHTCAGVVDPAGARAAAEHAAAKGTQIRSAPEETAAEKAARRTDEIKTMLSMSTQRPSDDPEGRQAWTSRPIGMKEGTERYVASESEPSGPPPAVHQSPRLCAADGQERSPSSPSSQPKAVASSSMDPQPHTSGEGADLLNVPTTSDSSEACFLCGLNFPSATVLVGDKVWCCNSVHDGASMSCALLALMDASPPTIALSSSHPWADGECRLLRCVVSQEANVHKLGYAPLRKGGGYVVVSNGSNSVASYQSVQWKASEWRPLMGDTILAAGLFAEVPPDVVRAAGAVAEQRATAFVAQAALLPKVQISYSAAWLYAEHLKAVVAKAAADEKAEHTAHASRLQGVRVAWGMDGDRRRVALFEYPEARIRSLKRGRELVLAVESENRQQPPLFEAVGQVTELTASTVKVSITEASGRFDADALVSVRDAWDATTWVRAQAAIRAFLVDGHSVHPEVRAAILGACNALGTSPMRLPVASDLTSACATLGICLNDAQRDVAIHALRRRLSLVQGPPGTGKTDVVTLLAFVMSQRCEGQVLCCASSNYAVDNFTQRLAASPLRVLRVLSPSRDHQANVPASCTMESHVARLQTHEATAYREYARLDKARPLLEEERTKFNKLRRKVEQQAVRLADVVCCTCAIAGGSTLRGLRFEQVIIDEAAQNVEAETLIPLTKGCRHAVLIGDHCQLGPVVKSRVAERAGLATSMFARLVAAGAQVFMLTVQYRMHPGISAFASGRFYGGRLTDGVRAEDRVGVELLPGVSQPLLWWHVEGKEGTVPPKGSVRNETEAAAVVQVVRGLQERGVGAGAICVMATYEAQRALLRASLRGPLAGVEVDTVDAFQGRQKDYVVVSPVRSNVLHGRAAVGFLFDWRRLVVASTRSRLGCVVVGNSHTLSHVPAWAALRDLVLSRGALYEGTYASLRAVRAAATSSPPPSPPPSPSAGPPTPMGIEREFWSGPLVVAEALRESPQFFHAPTAAVRRSSSVWGGGLVGLGNTLLAASSAWCWSWANEEHGEEGMLSVPSPPPSPPYQVSVSFANELTELAAARQRVKLVIEFHSECASALLLSDPSLFALCGCNDDVGTVGSSVRALGIPVVLISSGEAGDARKWFKGCNEQAAQFDLPFPQVVVCCKQDLHDVHGRHAAAGKAFPLRVTQKRRGQEKTVRKELAFNLDTHVGAIDESLGERLGNLHSQYRKEGIPYCLCTSLSSASSARANNGSVLVVPAASFGVASSDWLIMYAPRSARLLPEKSLEGVQAETRYIMRSFGDAAYVREDDTRRNQKAWFASALGVSPEQATSVPRMKKTLPPLALSWAAARLSTAVLCQRVGFPRIEYEEACDDPGLRRWRLQLLDHIKSGRPSDGLPVQRVVVVVLSEDGDKVVLSQHKTAFGFNQLPQLPCCLPLRTSTLVETARRAIGTYIPQNAARYRPLFRVCCVTKATSQPGPKYGPLSYSTAVFSVVVRDQDAPLLLQGIRSSGMEWVHIKDLLSQYKLAGEDVMLYVEQVRSVLGFQGQHASVLSAELVPPRLGNGQEEQAAAFLGYGEVLEPVDKLKAHRNADVDAVWRPERMGTLVSSGAPLGAVGERELASSFPAQPLETVEQSVEQYIAACKQCLTGERLQQALKAKRAKDGDSVLEGEAEDTELTSRSGQVDQVAALVLLRGDQVLCRHTMDGTVYLFAETLRPLTGAQYTAWLQRYNAHRIDVRRAKKEGKTEADLLAHKTEMERVELKEGVESAATSLARAIEPWLAGRAVESEVLDRLPALVKTAPETSYRFFSAVNEAGQSRRPTAPAKTTKYLLWVLQLPAETDFSSPAADPLAAGGALQSGPGFVRQFFQPTEGMSLTPEALRPGQVFSPSPVQHVDAGSSDKKPAPSSLCSMGVEHFLDSLGQFQPRLANAARAAIHVHATGVEVQDSGVAEAFAMECASHFAQIYPAEDWSTPAKEAQRSKALEAFIDEASRERVSSQLKSQVMDYSKRVYTQLRVGADVFYFLQSLRKTVETRLLRGLHRCVRVGDLLAIRAESKEPVLWMEVKRVKRLPSYAEAAREFGDLIYPGLREMNPVEVDRLFFELHANSMSREEWTAFFRKPGDRIVCWSVEPVPPDSIKPSGGQERDHIEGVSRVRRANAAAQHSEEAVKPGRGARQLARMAADLVDRASHVGAVLGRLRLSWALRGALCSWRRSRYMKALLIQGADPSSKYALGATRMQARMRGMLARRRAARLTSPIKVAQSPAVELDCDASAGQKQRS